MQRRIELNNGVVEFVLQQQAKAAMKMAKGFDAQRDLALVRPRSLPNRAVAPLQIETDLSVWKRVRQAFAPKDVKTYQQIILEERQGRPLSGRSVARGNAAMRIMIDSFCVWR